MIVADSWSGVSQAFAAYEPLQARIYSQRIDRVLCQVNSREPCFFPLLKMVSAVEILLSLALHLSASKSHVYSRQWKIKLAVST